MTSSTSSTGGSSPLLVLRFLLKWIVLPYVIGLCLSDYVPHEMAQKAVDTLWGNTSILGGGRVQNNISVATTSTTRILHKEKAEPRGDDEDGRNLQQDVQCWKQLLQSLDEEEADIVQTLLDNEKQGGVNLILHRNGDVQGCGISVDFLSVLRYKFTLNNFDDHCDSHLEKYTVESLLTSAFHQSLGNSCISQEADRDESEGFLGYCDMGPDKTPLLLDHDQLVPVITDAGGPDANNPEEKSYLPCHFHSREGVRLTSFQDLLHTMVQAYKREPNSTHCRQSDQEQDQETCSTNPEKEIHLYAVPAGRVFMFSPAFVGEIFDLPHIQGADPTQPVYMKVLSLSPRIFDIFNFFTREESDGLVTKAMAEKSESHRIKRSSTGTGGYNINTMRTSESGFDTHGATAQSVKRRCFSVLGFDEYIEGHSDGLQILRYNRTKAYTAHMDWIDHSGKEEHDYDSTRKGGNRYATILLYMTDLQEGDGGETVFVNAKPPDDAPSFNDALKELRASEQGALFKKNSWEEKLVARCRSSLAIRPNSARAVLFYSQLANGQPDPASLHGGCPVITDIPKWAANLWVWNTPRAGFAGAPMNEKVLAEKKKNGEVSLETPSIAPGPQKKHVTFQNSGDDPTFAKAQLFYEDQYWGPYGQGDAEMSVNSYEGQVWNVKVEGVVKKTFIVAKEEIQIFLV